MGNAAVSETHTITLLPTTFASQSTPSQPAVNVSVHGQPSNRSPSSCVPASDACSVPSLNPPDTSVIVSPGVHVVDTLPTQSLAPAIGSSIFPECEQPKPLAFDSHLTPLASVPPQHLPSPLPQPSSPQPQSAAQRKNKPPTQLTLATKIEICKRFAAGGTVPAVMREFNCARRTAFRIKKFQAYYLSLPQSETPYLRRIRNRTLLYPEIEKPLVNFVNVARSLKMPVTASIIQSKALALRNKAVSDCPDESRKDRLKAFKATEGWVAAFIKRNGLRSIKVDAHPSTALTDTTSLAAPTTPATLAQHLAPFSLDAIYTVDECILFYRLLPRTSYVTTKAGKLTLLSTPTMTVDDRVSLYVSCNASGTSRVPLTLVGRYAHPRSFGKQKPPLPYIAQQNAWTDALTFRNWFLNVFLPHVQKHHTQQIALLLNDGSVFRNDVCDARGQVKLFLLPSGDGGTFGSTAHQPMSVGVVATLKARYRRQLIRRSTENCDTVQQRREMARSMKSGTRGLCEGYDANLLDTAIMLEAAWEEIPQRVIAHSWQIAKVLPLPMGQKLCLWHGTPDTSRPVLRDMETLQELYMFVKELNQSRQLDGFGMSFSNLSDHDVAKWVAVEDDVEVCEALMNDNVAFLERLTENAITNDDNEAHTDPCYDSPMSEQTLPSAPVIAFAFKDVETFAAEVGLSDAIYHLRRAKQALMSEKARTSRGEDLIEALHNGAVTEEK